MPRRVYWDACCFLGLISQEPGKAADCEGVWKEGEEDKTHIYTSFFTFTEVIRARCEGVTKPLPEVDDAKILRILQQRFVRPLLLDEKIAVAARRLLRYHSECKKPSDGIHLASALALNVDEMHTYDGSDLLKLDGKVFRADGNPLKICLPAVIPTPPSPQQSLWSNDEKAPDQG